MNAKHTHGPWTIQHEGVNYIIGPKIEELGIGTVAARTVGDSLMCKANANLIAAAPEMLEALKAVVELEPIYNDTEAGAFCFFCGAEPQHHGMDIETIHLPDCAYIKAKSAIDKAKGE